MDDPASATALRGGEAHSSIDLTILLSGDRDNDTVPDIADNCLIVSNPDQVNTDDHGLGDACDEDRDNDGIKNSSDQDVLDPRECVDTDADECDDCAIGQDGFGILPDHDPAKDGTDRDMDGTCRATDPDDDGDGVDDDIDNCPLVANPGQDMNDCGGPFRDLCIPLNPVGRRLSLLCPAALIQDPVP